MSMCLVAQLCPTLCHSMDCSLPVSSIHGILQARILEWVAIAFSRGASWPRDRSQVSYTTGGFFTIWATWGVAVFFNVSNNVYCDTVYNSLNYSCLGNSTERGLWWTVVRYNLVTLNNNKASFLWNSKQSLKFPCSAEVTGWIPGLKILWTRKWNPP